MSENHPREKKVVGFACQNEKKTNGAVAHSCFFVSTSSTVDFRPTSPHPHPFRNGSQARCQEGRPRPEGQGEWVAGGCKNIPRPGPVVFARAPSVFASRAALPSPPDTAAAHVTRPNDAAPPSGGATRAGRPRAWAVACVCCCARFARRAFPWCPPSFRRPIAPDVSPFSHGRRWLNPTTTNAGGGEGHGPRHTLAPTSRSQPAPCDPSHTCSRAIAPPPPSARL